ncbi:MAG: flagellar type III secretion system protein FlhB [Nitrosomonadales bacterium]|nr:flagellar type III secretion system protein FlhB [Nitrosomonadales bacterium]
MAEDSDLERTEQPSQRRIDQAREEGQVARSRELSTFAVMMAGGAGIWLMGSSLSGQLIRLLHDGLTVDRELAFHSDLLLLRLYTLSADTLLVFLPLLLLLLLTAAFSPLLLNGWLFTLKPLQPNFTKLNPIEGISRMFSVNSLAELGKAIGKSVIVGGIGAWAIWHNKDAVMELIAQPAVVSVPHLGYLMWMSFAAIMGGMLLIVAVDVPLQLWEHNKKLKMTKEEVRQEAKETEGDPQVKGRIRSMQREMARRRMMAEIPTADVVVTNPTHYSVALRYADGSMKAPIVVAKGSHHLAAKIKEIAIANNVPILEAPPLARALHKYTELGETIPEALYMAVAEVLSYVYQLRRYNKVGGARPEEPHELPVPPQLDPANEEARPA